MTSTLVALYLRSRRAGWAALLIVAAAGLRRILVPWTTIAGPFSTLISLLLLAAAATVTATSLASPFGQVEHAACALLPPLRLLHLTAAGLVAAAGFVVAAATGDLPVPADLRDLAGFTGIALLTATVLGGHRCWTIPLGYAVFCASEQDLQHATLWAWPILPTTNPTATLIAAGLLLAGAAAVVLIGVPSRE